MYQNIFVMYNQLAPVVLFVYNRLDHTRQTVEALQKNELATESMLYVFADGAKDNATEEQRGKVQEVRDYIKSISGFKQVIVEESSQNRGLATSIIEGVTKIVNEFGKVIVLEDDIVTSKGFLKYMNDALSLYEKDESVLHIAGYMYPLKNSNLPETFFYPAASCWGWATWKRAWNLFNSDADYLYSAIKSNGLLPMLNINKIHGFEEQLISNIKGNLHTWFIKWHSSVVLNRGYCLYPRKSLVQNIGFDGSGEHCGPDYRFYHRSLARYVKVKRIPIEYNNRAIQFLQNFGEGKMSITVRLKNKIKYRIRKFVIKLFPEFNDVLHNGCGYTIKNTIWKSSISKTACIYPKYEIVESDIGDFTYIARNSHIQYSTIGKFCSIGPNLICGWGIHPVEALSTSPMFYSTRRQNGRTLSMTDKIEELKPIKIGNDVFIGANVTVLDGVSIGDGAIIGAGAVVSKDIPPYAVAVGCPIRIIRYRFSDEIREKLLRIKWWDFDEERLKEVEQLEFDVETFVNSHS